MPIEESFFGEAAVAAAVAKLLFNKRKKNYLKILPSLKVSPSNLPSQAK